MMVFNPFIYHPYKAVQYNILSRNKFAAVLFKKNNGDRMTDRQTDRFANMQTETETYDEKTAKCETLILPEGVCINHLRPPKQSYSALSYRGRRLIRMNYSIYQRIAFWGGEITVKLATKRRGKTIT